MIKREVTKVAKLVVYQMWAPSWKNMEEMTAHLYRIARLGVTHVWLSGALASPWYDHGYDVADYCRVNPRFATDGDADAEFAKFIATAHQLGICVVIDLVLNHTSTEHPWFQGHPEYYCWEKQPREGWGNLFDGGSAYKYDAERQMYYLHLFHPKQADLKWFVDGKVNPSLVAEFKKIVRFWKERGVDGFRLDVPQAINKDLSLSFEDLLRGRRDQEVLNAVFEDEEEMFLMMECFDPTFGQLAKRYVAETPVDFVMNALMKGAISAGEKEFLELVYQFERSPGAMINFEDHDGPRFTSSSGLSPARALFHLFNSQSQAICLYQGQELGLYNPSWLSSQRICELDAQAAMQMACGIEVDRSLVRANARMPLNIVEYEWQMRDFDSCYRYTQHLIARFYRL